MAKKWVAINLLLLAVAGLLGWQLRASFLRFIAENDLSQIQPARGSRRAALPGKRLAPSAQEKSLPSADFSIIPAKSIFSDLRGKEDPAVAIAPPEPPQLMPKPILVGILMVDNRYRALIIEPSGSALDRNRRPITKRVGDVYRGFTITSIASDRIVLENGSRKETIPLHEGTKRTQPGKTPILSTRVVPFGGSAASGGIPVIAVTRSAPAVRTPVVTTGAPQAGQPNITMPGTAQRRQSAVTPPVQEPATPPTTPPITVPGSGGGTRTVRSPFGDIIRTNGN